MDKPKPRPSREPDSAMARAFEALKDTISRLPDAVAGAMANAASLGPGPTPAAEGASTGGAAAAAHDGHGASQFFRSVVPAMARYFARADRAARPGGDAQAAGSGPGSAHDAFAALLRKRQGGYGAADWRAFLAGSGVALGPHAFGPGRAAFGVGDVSAEMDYARKQRAYRASLWPSLAPAGQGGSYSDRRWAMLQAMMGNPVTAGAGAIPDPTVGQAVPGQVFRRGWRPGITPNHQPSGTSFRAPGDLGRGPSGWLDLLGPAGRPPAGWYDGLFAKRAKRDRGAAVRRHARAFGGGFRRGGGDVAGAFRAGRDAFGRAAGPGRAGIDPGRGWRDFRRHSKRSSARFGRGAAQLFGAGASTFARFQGAGLMAGSAMAKLASAAGALGAALGPLGPVGAGLGAIGGTFAKLHAFAEHAFAANRRFALYDPTVSAAYSEVAIGDVKRNMQTAHENRGAMVALAKSINGMRDETRVGESLATGLTTRAATVASETLGTVAHFLNKTVLSDANRALNAADPDGSKSQQWIQGQMQGAMGNAGYYYGGLEYIFNALRGNPQGGSMRDAQIQQANAWAEAERQRQLDAKLGPIPAWHASLNAIKDIDKPWLPPRKIAPPRGRRP